MQKIPTIFVRDFANRGQITQEWHPACLWVRDGEGVATVKYDGTSCRWDGARLWKRREIKEGQQVPEDFQLAGKDEETGKVVGWVPVGEGPDDQYHREALAAFLASAECPPLDFGTYELIGPKVQGNKHGADTHRLVRHGSDCIAERLADRATIEQYLKGRVTPIEGIVWHHPDGRMAKIKRRDFGLPW